jgi:hypothetical protein
LDGYLVRRLAVSDHELGIMMIMTALALGFVCLSR